MMPEKTIGRLAVYRRLLKTLKEENNENVFSHQLAELSGGTAAQVRRDLMHMRYSGNPRYGYNVAKLIYCIDSFFNTSESQNMILIGIGNIG
ncbi:MAG: redox-sensing transcriptional repressor Rex, partial [Oligoflexia bacterium]|nr:redox-sensing transcriptional repressor Rex [Oligoflexia bacterium]